MIGYRAIEGDPKRLYVVGDIHGCLDEATRLLQHLRSAESLSQHDQLIFIGDYIDRGPDSKGVIELLVHLKEEFPKTVFLKGNHEDMCLAWAGLGGHMGDVYLANGGSQMLRSYGLAPDAQPEEFLAALPERHRDFLTSLERYVVTETYVFVHAGLDPLRDLYSQVDEDLFWIRDEFIHNIHHFGKLVVFGHTPFENVVFHHPYKVGVDTGLVYGNMLSCLELLNGKLFQISRGRAVVEVNKISHSMKS